MRSLSFDFDNWKDIFAACRAHPCIRSVGSKSEYKYYDEWNCSGQPLPSFFRECLALVIRPNLNFSNTNLASLPDTLSDKIVSLNISHNLFTSVPSALAKLELLQTLDISDNKISFIPFWLGKLPELRTLKASRNPLEGDQRQFAEKYIGSSDALLNYLRTCEEKVTASRITVTVLGHFKAGKTALLNAIRKIRCPKEHERTTHVTISDWTDKKSKLSFSFRELPGQAQFYVSNHHFLFSFNNAIAMIVVKLTDDEHVQELQQLRLYLSRIQQNAIGNPDSKEQPHVATILVFTHVDVFLKRKGTSETALRAWVEQTRKEMAADYIAAGVADALLLNCTSQKRTRAYAKLAFRTVGAKLLAGRSVPKYIENLHAMWSAQRANREPWLPKDRALVYMQDHGFHGSSAAAALDFLITMGDVISVGSNIMILDPSWLSIAISALVLPPEPPFHGIPEGRGEGRMDNGVASAATLHKRLMTTHVESKERKPLVRNADEAKDLLSWLQSLDIVLPLDHTADSKTDSNGLLRQQRRLPPTHLSILSSFRHDW